MLTQAEIEAIRERADKAWKGPWKFTEDSDDTYYVEAEEYAEVFAEGIPWRENADFIAKSRTDIPKLLAEIERMRNKLTLLDSDISASLAYKIPIELSEISGYINEILLGGEK